MKINKQSFLNEIKRRIYSKPIQNVKSNVKQVKSGVFQEMAKNYAKATKNNVKTVYDRRKLAKSLMSKYYVSPSMGQQTWMKRYKQTLNLVNQGKVRQARENLQKLKEQFKKNNPLYKD